MFLPAQANPVGVVQRPFFGNASRTVLPVGGRLRCIAEITQAARNALLVNRPAPQKSGYSLLRVPLGEVRIRHHIYLDCSTILCSRKPISSAITLTSASALVITEMRGRL